MDSSLTNKTNPLFKILFCGFLFILFPLFVFAQKKDSVGVAKKDTIFTVDSISKASTENFIKDSIFYNKLQKRMYKKHITHEIYDFLFKNVYNSGRDHKEVAKIEENQFTKYEGKIIEDSDWRDY